MPPHPPLRIAILEADVPLGAARARYGSYGGVFAALLHRAADDSASVPRARLRITGWDVVNAEGAADGAEEYMGGEGGWTRRKGYPPLEDVDAVLITGSRHNAFDNDPWIERLVEFVRTVLAQDRVRVIGVCYGHQVVGRALGAAVARSEGGAWEVSVCRVAQTEKGREVFGGGEALSLFQMHRDRVSHYPPGVEALGSSGPCAVQGMYIARRAMTVQGHPEFTAEIVTELLERRREQGIFSEAVYGEAMARVGMPHDGVLVARAFLTFLMEDGT